VSESEAAAAPPTDTPAVPAPARAAPEPLDFFSIEPPEPVADMDDEEEDEEEVEPERTGRAPSGERGGRSGSRAGERGDGRSRRSRGGRGRGEGRGREAPKEGRGQDRGREKPKDGRGREKREEGRGPRTPARTSESQAGGLEALSLAALHEMASDAGISRYRLLRRQQLIEALRKAGAAAPPAAPARAGSESPPRERGRRERRPRERPAGERRAREAPDRVREARARGREARARDDRPPDGGPGGPPEEGAPDEATERREGTLELMGDGFGFVRLRGGLRSAEDPYVSRSQTDRLDLRAGDRIAGLVRPPRRSERQPAMVEVEQVNGRAAEGDGSERPAFDDLEAQRPQELLRLEPGEGIAVRMFEIATPLGKGQRALVAGPSAAGATTLLRGIAASLAGSAAHVIAALVDARPEEVPDWPTEGVELFVTTAENDPVDQTGVADLALERAKRLVEEGRDVVLVIDSISRLAHAHALAEPAARGGEAEGEAGAVHVAKRWFAAARATDRGSLTIVAAARSDGSSAFDAELCEALASTANLDLRLDGDLAARGMHPAVDLLHSRTLGEDALVGEERRHRLQALRGVTRSLDVPQAWEFLAEKLRETDSNDELLSD
jgi:transcription termination factor Rho